MREPELAEHFTDLGQQEEAAKLGMWIFLATEVLFFGGFFLAYGAYRIVYPVDFGAGSRELNETFGTLNTAILLTSSWTMALAVLSAQKGKIRRLRGFLAATWLLGSAFLVVKGFEYAEDFRKNLLPHAGPGIESGKDLFFYLYYAMTGLHGFHMLVGLGVVAWMWIRCGRGEFSSRFFTPVELSGLYWHFVDVIWIFLYPMLYLIDRHP